jgi:hypothetical protein
LLYQKRTGASPTHQVCIIIIIIIIISHLANSVHMVTSHIAVHGIPYSLAALRLLLRVLVASVSISLLGSPSQLAELSTNTAGLARLWWRPSSSLKITITY